WCASFTVFRELAGSKEKPRSTVAQYVGIVDLLALELGHLHRIHLRRRCLATLEQLTRVLALGVGATEELAEAPSLELHLAAAFVALQARAFIALDAVLTFFDLVAGAIWVIAADMQLMRFVQQISIHGCAAD